MKCDEDFTRSIEHAEDYLNNELRSQKIQVENIIPINNENLITNHDIDRKLDRVSEALGYLEDFHQSARYHPLSKIRCYPLFDQWTELRLLTSGIREVSSESKNASKFLRDHQFIWALPMIEDWYLCSTTSWKSIVENLIQNEEVVTLFLTKLLELLSLYRENVSRHLTKLECLEFRTNYSEKDCIAFVEHVKKYVHSTHMLSVNPDLPLRHFLENEFIMDSLRFRSPNAKKLHRLLSMYYQETVIEKISKGNNMRIVYCFGPFVVLSNVLKSLTESCLECEEFQIQAAVKLFIDCNICFHGKSISLIAPCIEIISGVDDCSRVIDVSGVDGISTNKPSGTFKDTTKNKLDGDDGEDADHGDAGESGGNIWIKCWNITNFSDLIIKSVGGNGGNGADGGDGGNGLDGEDGTEGKPPEASILSHAYALLGRGSLGQEGGKGGKGGGLSRGGEPGFEGKCVVDIETFETHSENVLYSLDLRCGDKGILYLYIVLLS